MVAIFFQHAVQCWKFIFLEQKISTHLWDFNHGNDLTANQKYVDWYVWGEGWGELKFSFLCTGEWRIIRNVLKLKHGGHMYTLDFQNKVNFIHSLVLKMGNEEESINVEQKEKGNCSEVSENSKSNLLWEEH